jgi:hypothetical protein
MERKLSVEAIRVAFHKSPKIEDGSTLDESTFVKEVRHRFPMAFPDRSDRTVENAVHIPKAADDRVDGDPNCLSMIDLDWTERNGIESNCLE